MTIYYKHRSGDLYRQYENGHVYVYVDGEWQQEEWCATYNQRAMNVDRRVFNIPLDEFRYKQITEEEAFLEMV